MNYPQRDKFFSHKFVRQLAKMCVANELGTDVFTLLVIVAHTEDAKRYQGPVSWYNEQLLPICGLRNVKALDRARTTAVEAGWLHYEPGGKSKPGRYWVLTGSGDISLDSNATDLEETDLPPVSLVENNQANGIERDLKGNRLSFERGLSGKNGGSNVGNSLPYPFPVSPVPNPSPTGSSESERQEPQNPGPSGFTITAPRWNTPSVHAALTLWAQHYPSRHDGAQFTDPQAATLLSNKASEGWTPKVLVSSISLSVERGYANIRDHRKIEADEARLSAKFGGEVKTNFELDEIKPPERGLGYA